MPNIYDPGHVVKGVFIKIFAWMGNGPRVAPRVPGSARAWLRACLSARAYILARVADFSQTP